MENTSYWVRFTLLLIYFASLQVSYWYYFKPVSAGEYYEYNWVTVPTEPNAVLYAVLAAVLLSIVAANVRNKPTDLFLIVLLMAPVMPMLVLYSDRKVYTEYMAFVVVMYIMIFSIGRFPAAAPDPGPFDTFRFINARHLPLLVTIAALLFIAIDIAAGNLANLNFDFQRVYEFRRLAEANRAAIPLFSYYETNLSSFLLGLGAAVAIHQRQYFLLLILGAASVMRFGLTSNRGHFFIVFLALVFYAVARQKRPFVWIVGGASVTALLAAALYQISPTLHLVGDFTVGRVMFIPSYVNFFYFEFFSQNPYTYWSDTNLTLGLVQNPYGLTGPRVIFDHYYGVDLSADVFYGNANTGFFGAGYGHAGFLGLFLYSVVVGLMIRLPNALADKTNNAIAFGALSYMFVVALLTSSDLPTLIFTYGYLIAVVLTLTIRRNSLDSPKRAAESPAGAHIASPHIA